MESFGIGCLVLSDLEQDDILDNMKLAIRTSVRFVIKCLSEPGLGMG